LVSRDYTVPAGVAIAPSTARRRISGELRCADTDPGAVANLIQPVKHIDDLEAERQCAGGREMEGISGTEIELQVGGQDRWDVRSESVTRINRPRPLSWR
jgi:hypothetical protein